MPGRKNSSPIRQTGHNLKKLRPNDSLCGAIGRDLTLHPRHTPHRMGLDECAVGEYLIRRPYFSRVGGGVIPTFHLRMEFAEKKGGGEKERRWGRGEKKTERASVFFSVFPRTFPGFEPNGRLDSCSRRSASPGSVCVWGGGRMGHRISCKSDRAAACLSCLRDQASRRWTWL